MIRDSAVEGMFRNYDKERKGYLILENFLDFFEKATQKKSQTVWNNLMALGYSPEYFADAALLLPAPDPLE
jgi:hypothetical protein